MAKVISWKESFPRPHFESGALSPKLSSYEVSKKLEEAYAKNDTITLIKFLAYANIFHMPVKEGRKIFKKIEEEWPLIQKDYPQLVNKVIFLTSILSEHYATRNDSAQIRNRSALIAEFSYL